MSASTQNPEMAAFWAYALEVGEFEKPLPTDSAATTFCSQANRFRARLRKESPTNESPYDGLSLSPRKNPPRIVVRRKALPFDIPERFFEATPGDATDDDGDKNLPKLEDIF